MSDVSPADAFTTRPARYVVGIDLGTTNSAVASVNTEADPWRVESFPVVQLVAPGEAAARDVLPSFLYLPPDGQWTVAETRLPWHHPHASDEPGPGIVGTLARDHGVSVTGRLVSSAKSWLCHGGVDRTAAILPWQADEGVPRLSPVTVSSRYLAQMRAAWDHAHPDVPLAEQDVIVTIPASFDEVARELTIEAARRAGLPRILLIEEPQAAFYAWIARHRDRWDDLIRPGQTILILDIGGGTTDFTLIRVRRPGPTASTPPGQTATNASPPNDPALTSAEPGGGPPKVTLHRVAVGDHLILGGDNLDLAVAYELERRLAERTAAKTGSASLSTANVRSSAQTRRQWEAILRQARAVKETLLGTDTPEQLTVSLPKATGAKLVGSVERITITREDIHTLLLDGFFPRCALDAQPQSRGSGFTEFGLPFAPDSGVTRYLAKFLSDHRHTGLESDTSNSGKSELKTSHESGRYDPGLDQVGHDLARPDLILFNGGVLESAVVRDRLLEVIGHWFPGTEVDGSPWRPIVLDGDRRDQAVARGAAYFGMTRRGQGVRIGANLARTYYLAVAGVDRRAVCVIPGRAEPGERFVLDQRFDLTVGRPIELPIWVSSTRLTDAAGALVPIDDDAMRALPPLRTVIRPSRRVAAVSERSETVPVRLVAELTEIGTLALALEQIDGTHRWSLDFDVRAATQTDQSSTAPSASVSEAVEQSTWDAIDAALDACFVAGTLPPRDILPRIGEAIGTPRETWSAAVLRRIWRWLIEHDGARRTSPAHEARWLNLVGFTLRPGYGVPLDDWRVGEVWRKTQGKIVHPRSNARAEMLVLWRRIAGGLTAGQQQAIATPHITALTALHRQTTTGRGGGAVLTPAESVETWRLVGSLERLPLETKRALFAQLIDLWDRPKLASAASAMVWALGRLGSRVPVYGPLDRVLPPATIEPVLRTLIRARRTWSGSDLIAVMQLARRSGDRHRDIDDALRTDVIEFLTDAPAPPHLVALVAEGGDLEGAELSAVVGESLPLGLTLAADGQA